jgi:hypothetical protein
MECVFFYIIIKYGFITSKVIVHNMLMEAITISSILGASALAVWFVRSRFQPEIGRSLTKIEAAAAKEETTVTKQRLSKETD